MWLAFKQFLAIARLTALEAIRLPIAFLLFSTVLCLIAVLPLTLSHTLGESMKFVRDGALAFMWVSGLLLSAHLACSSITAEMRRGTVSAVLSKPVQRPIFFLAKFTGIVWILTLFSIGLIMAVMISTRTARTPYIADWRAAVPFGLAIVCAFLVGGLINFFLRRPFVSNTFVALFVLLTGAFLYAGLAGEDGGFIPFGELYDFRILPAGLLIGLAILVLAALSVSLATRFRTIPTLAICGGLFLLGLLSDYLFGRFVDSSWLSALLYRILPNWQHFWVVDALAGEGSIPLSYVGLAAGYALVYLSGILLLGMASFQRTEVAA